MNAVTDDEARFLKHLRITITGVEHPRNSGRRNALICAVGADMVRGILPIRKASEKLGLVLILAGDVDPLRSAWPT